MTQYRRENQDVWNEWSEDFQALWNANTVDGEPPPTPSPFAPDAPGDVRDRVVDTVEGKAYVELGCGGGQGSVGTAALGANPVVGIDFSDEQLAHARHLRDWSGVDATFLQADVTSLPFGSDTFDLASSEWVFQMVDHLDSALSETRRVLRDGGVFVLSVPHPLYEAIEADTGTLERSYYDTGPREITIDEGYDSSMIAFDRTVAALHNALVDAGFDVRRLIEHQRPEVESNDPDESELPSILWKIPQSVRFCAVAVDRV